MGNAIKNFFDPPPSPPPPPPTYFPTASPTMGPTTLTSVALTFFNAIKDDNQYYLSINEVNGVSWSSLPLKYGESLEFSKTVPTPVGYTGFDYSQYQVVRLTANNIVANMFPFPLDNSNSLLVVAWNDAQNQIYTDALGSYGASNVACIYGLNLAYPLPTSSNAMSPTISIQEGAGLTITPLYNPLKTYSSVSTAYNPTATAYQSYAIFNGGLCGQNVPFDISGYTFSCALKGRATLKLTAPAGTKVPLGTNAFFFCLNDPKLPTKLIVPATYNLVALSKEAAKPDVSTQDALASPTTVGPISTGYLALAQYGESTCRTAPLYTDYYALGRCAQTGVRTSVLMSATVSGNGVLSFVGTDFLSSNCDPATAGPGLLSEGLNTTAGCFKAAPRARTYWTSTYVATLPPLPTGYLTRTYYNTSAQCASNSAAPLLASYVAPQTCSLYYGNAYRRHMCAANMTITSTTGGFVFQRFYSDAGCQGVPVVSQFYQLNVCGQMSDSGSFMHVASKAPGSSVTVFSTVRYATNDCSGTPLPPSLLSPLPATYDMSKLVTTTTRGNTTAQGATNAICAPSGLSNPGLPYATVLYAPVLALSSGWGVARFSSQGACNALDTTRLFSGTLYAPSCVLDANTASNYVAAPGCDAVGSSSAGTPTTVKFTYSFQGVSAATAQSPAFQSKVVQVVAAYVGVAATNVSVVSVTTSGGSRRTLLQYNATFAAQVRMQIAIKVRMSMAAFIDQYTGPRPYGPNGPTPSPSPYGPTPSPSPYAVRTDAVANSGPAVNVAVLANVLRNAGPVIVNGLSASYPGFSLYVAPPPAPPSTSWATPGAIAGVVIAGAVAISLIVLLSVFIPRMQYYQQAQVFGQGFQPHAQQQQQQAPLGAFFSSPHQEEGGLGMQMGGKVVSF